MLLTDISFDCITDLTDNINKDRSEKKGGAPGKEERSGGRSRGKDDNKGESKSATTEKSMEVRGEKKSMCVCVTERVKENKRLRVFVYTEAIKCFATERQQILKYLNY